MKLTLATIFLVFTLFIGSCVPNLQFITLYTEANQQGRNLTLDTHYANLSVHRDFLRNTSSYCAVGWIVFYTNYNFNLDGGIAFLIDQNDNTLKCQNRIFSNYNSMRYLGNRNSDLPGLSLYSKANYHGLEVFINENGTASAELTFPVLSLATTGWGNYTLYEGANYTGSSWCVQSTKKVQLLAQVDVNLSSIASIQTGCNLNSTKIVSV